MEILAQLEALLGPTCFNLFDRYIGQKKIADYPFLALAPLVRGSADLEALAEYLKQEHVFEEASEGFWKLVDRVSETKSPIIKYELLKQEQATSDLPEAVRHFVSTEIVDPEHAVTHFAENFLRETSRQKINLSYAIWSCLLYTSDEQIQNPLSQCMEDLSGSEPKTREEKDRLDYLLHTYANRYSTTDEDGEILFIESALGLMPEPMRSQLLEIWRANGAAPDMLEIFHEFSVKYMNGAHPREYQHLLEKLFV